MQLNKLPLEKFGSVIFMGSVVMIFSVGNVFAQTSISLAPSHDLMVVLKEKPNTRTLINLSDKIASHQGELKGGVPNSSILVYRVDSDATAAAAILQKDPSVKYAFPMPKFHIQKTTNDPLLTNQWGLQSLKVAGSGETAWDLAGDLNNTSGVKVAVIDTGVDRTHPDLAGKVDDSDWVVCDYNHTPQCYIDPTGIDDNGHGTHVAGLIGANPDNNVGVAGVGWSTKILSIKALGVDGSGSMMNIFLAAAYALDHGVKIMNLSLGATESSLGSEGIATVQSLVDEIWNQGGLMIVAAGNCGDGLDPGCAGVVNPRMYPAASNNVLSVGAITSTGVIAPYSELGSWVTVVAPGGSCQSSSQSQCILSTWSGNGFVCGLTGSPSGYCYDQGTSMASPQVAGVAALMLAKNPNLTNSQILQIIESTSNSAIAQGASQFGEVDAKAALTATAIVVTTPTSTIIPPSPTSSITVVPTLSIVPSITSYPTDVPREIKSQTDIPTGPLCVHSCPLHEKGDANCDGQINASDIDSWARHFDTILPGDTQMASGNFICTEGNIVSNYIDLIDFEEWRRNTSSYISH